MSNQDTEAIRGFLIDGKEYPAPSIDTFNMDEAQILYDYSGLTLEDLVADESDPEALAARNKKLGSPGLLRTLMHVAYARGNPSMKPQAVKKAIGESNWLDAIKAFASTGEVDAGPPELKSSSTSSSDSSNEHSGDASMTSSGQQDETPAATGTTESDTSVTSDQTESES